MNVNDMYSTLPKSLTMELAVKTKVIEHSSEILLTSFCLDQ